MTQILIIDDDPNICEVLVKMVKSMGHHGSAAGTLEEGLNLAQRTDYDLILLDLEFPRGNGLQILPDLLKAPSLPEVIIVTGTGDIRGAELAFKYGAWDYIRKPFLLDEVTLPITRALQYRKEKKAVKSPITLKNTGIIGESTAIRICFDEIARASMSEASTLISGETGTGKELIARAIHANSKRSSGNFIAVDCGALPETLVESTLFGHEKGAFTGADKKHEGLIQQAENGTLFFDEIGELPLTVQKSLLRTLQERCLRPLGGNKEVPVDYRLIAATNRDLDQMVQEKYFREDLLYRIRAIEIKVPPLRDRENDIQEIAVHKIHRLCRLYGMGNKGVSQEFFKILQNYTWPGNVRELINVMESSLSLAGSDPTLLPKHLPPKLRSLDLDYDSVSESPAETESMDIPDDGAAFPRLAEFRDDAEKKYLIMLLEIVGGSRDEACRKSGISQSRLYGLLKKHNLSRFNS